MKRLLVSLLTLVLVSLLLAPVAHAGTTLTGTAMGCSGLNTCTYTLSGSTGTGSASTSGGRIYLHLPGEALVTSGAYNVTYAPTGGWSNTAGALYQFNGSFNTLDATMGTIVSGTTTVIEGEKGHSGRGGGIYWTFVSGSITVQQSSQRSSKTAIACSPTLINPGQSVNCVVTVIDPGARAVPPIGTISFGQRPANSGTFSPGSSCALVSGTCSVTLDVSINALYSVVISASYPGDGLHIAGSASQTITINEDS